MGISGESQWHKELILQVQQYQGQIPIRPLCAALNLAPATYYRSLHSLSKPPVRPPPPRKLTEPEREAVLQTLNSEEFVDKTPAEAYASLLDQGKYLCSISSMYRLLRETQMVRERRQLVIHTKYTAPQLVATATNQVWSWDISKLKGNRPFLYYHLYVVIDIFSRYVVGWMLADREDQALAKELLQTCVEREKIEPGTLTIHSDRGAAMKSKPVAALLASLGIIKSHSRPHTSNDNPFSESFFKTLKYSYPFPKRFESKEHATEVVERLVSWYNNKHKHAGIALFSPAEVHTGKHVAIQSTREHALLNAYSKHPERFVKGIPAPPELPSKVWINPPKNEGKNASKNETSQSAWQGQSADAAHCPNKPRAAEVLNSV